MRRSYTRMDSTVTSPSKVDASMVLAYVHPSTCRTVSVPTNSLDSARGESGSTPSTSQVPTK